MKPQQANPWRVGSLKTITYCTLCVAVIGFVLLLAGAILTGIAYTEVRPNMADENYDRYIKANVSRVVGPIMLAFGILNIFGGCLFLTITFFCSSKARTIQSSRNTRYNVRASAEHLPDVDQKKMLSTV